MQNVYLPGRERVIGRYDPESRTFCQIKRSSRHVFKVGKSRAWAVDQALLAELCFDRAAEYWHIRDRDTGVHYRVEIERAMQYGEERDTGRHGIQLVLPWAYWQIAYPDEHRGVPEVDHFMAFVRAEIEQTAREAQRMVESEQMVGRMSAELIALVKVESERMLGLIEERGHQYGEDVLFLLGEQGFAVMVATKALRLLWSMQQGLPDSERDDSFEDLASYAMLRAAWRTYTAQQEGV